MNLQTVDPDGFTKLFNIKKKRGLISGTSFNNGGIIYLIKA
jgi:hypothetical protein